MKTENQQNILNKNNKFVEGRGLKKRVKRKFGKLLMAS
jgi:hypothetical protein